MSTSRKSTSARRTPSEQEIRNQEVLRANRELAAYFKGRRTEREARAAVKIIKAFIRDREHIDVANRPPLPLVVPSNATPKVPKRHTSTATTRIRRRRASQQMRAGSQVAPVEAPAETLDITAGNNGA